MTVAAVAAAVLAVSPAARAAAEDPDGPVQVADRVEAPDIGVVASPPPRPNSGPLSPPTEPSSPDAAPGPVDLALARAAASGRRVEVAALRTGTTTTYANPSGTLTKTLGAAPARETAGGAQPGTIDATAGLGMVRDTSVYQASPNQANDASRALHAGTTVLTGPVRSFLRFNTTPIEGKNILSGSVSVYQNWSGAGGCTASPLTVQGATDLAATATWNNQPTLDGRTWGSAMTAGDDTACRSQVGHKPIAITGLIAKWAGDAATSGTLALLASETNPSQAKGFLSSETGIGTPLLNVEYLTTPNQPTELSPAAGATVATLRPALSGRLTGGDGQNLRARFSLRDADDTEIATHSALVAPNSRASWTPAGDLLEPGERYTWTLRGCAGTAPQEFCSAAASASFTVDAGLGAGNRPLFTYTSVNLNDRAVVRVNVASGNLLLEATDLEIAGTGTPLTFRRAYNSVVGDERMLGHRWAQSHTDTVRLEGHADGSFTYRGDTGETALIRRNADNTYSPSADLDATFIDAGGFGVYVLRFNHDRGIRRAGESLYFYNSGARKGMLYGVFDRNNHGPTLTYDAGNVPTRVVDSQSRPVNYTLSGGHLTKLDDPNGQRHVVYTYDGYDDLVKVTDAAGGETLYQYDAKHNLTRIVDPNGGEVRVGYDARSRVTSLTRELGDVDQRTTFQYTDNPAGQQDKTVVTDANGHRTEYLHDNANRVEKVTNPLGQEESASYDVNSNITQVSQPGNLTYTFGYDQSSRNNLTSARIPTGATETLNYNNSATSGLTPYQPTRWSDAQGNQVDYTHDAANNRLTTVNDLATENTTSATYQGTNGVNCGAQQGQICTSTDARGKVTRYGYDARGNLTSVNHPAPLGDVTIGYDNVSRVSRITDGNGQVRTFTYDELDRVKTVTYHDGAGMSYDYDGNGNVTARTDRAGSWTMDYDDDNRLVQSTGPGLDDVSFSYDPAGNVKTVTDPGGTTQYQYTAVNMVKLVRDPQGAETRFDYHPDHGTWRTKVTYPNGVTMTLDYDDSGRTTRVKSRDAEAALLTSFEHSFRNASNQDTSLRQNDTTPEGTYAYLYDAVNRLTRANYTNNGGPARPNFFYAYDGAGNRTQRSSGTSTFYTYNDADQLTSGGATHDGNGNLTATSSYGIAAARYNASDHTTSLTPRGGAAIAQTHAGATQAHWRTSGDRKFTTAGSMGITYIDDPAGDSSLVRDPDGNLVSMRRGGKTFHYLFDARGSVAGLTDAYGAMVNAYRYEPYGARLSATEAVPNPWQHNAEFTLDGTVYKIGARYYDAGLGRWSQVDLLPAQLRYAFADNDPINKSDPTGLFSWEEAVGDITGAFSGALVGIPLAIGLSPFVSPVVAGGIGAAVGGCFSGAISDGVTNTLEGESTSLGDVGGACAVGAFTGGLGG